MTDRVARSRAAFLGRFPELTDAVDAQSAQSSIVRADDTAVDISFGERRIYGGDARRMSRDQVEGFLQKPLRLIMESPGAGGLVSQVCIDLMLAMERTLKEAGVSELSRGPISAPTFLVVFGIGLGCQLSELIRRTGARWVILVEPFAEFISYSFEAIDWSEIFAQVDAIDGDIHVVNDIDPARMVAAIMRHVSAHGAPYLDGSWVFTHYPLWAFAEASKRLHGAAEFAYINRGYFEDELVMMTNAVTNFAQHSFWLLDTTLRRHRPETVVIVGAGPSLDEAIETLHRIRDRVVLFSAGTALRPLLKNGLVPDFHCELENGPQVYETIGEAKAHGDLSTVRLIASSTVDPRVASLFGEAILFFRDSVSPSMILADETGTMVGAAPTCVNTAIATACRFGFTNFVLFGVDCGMRPGTPDHAEGTIYRDLEKWRKYLEKRAQYTIQVEGNFGGVVLTNWVYDASRRLLMELIAAFHVNVVNCSDGALIVGATPRVPESIEIDGSVLDHARLIDELKRTMKHCAPGELLRGDRLVLVRRQAQALYRDLREMVDRFDRTAADFAGVFNALSDFVRNAGDSYGKMETIPDGSLHALPRIGMFYGCRTSEPGMRRRLFAQFCDELAKAFDAMERQTEALFDQLAKMVEDRTAIPAQ